MNALDINEVCQCKLCPLLGKDHVPSVGNPNANLFILGQSPGATEVQIGQPFVGRCGALLNRLLNQLGLTRSDVYIANTLKCRPPNNRTGFIDEIKNCANHWLYHELMTFSYNGTLHPKSKKILLLGKDAWKAFNISISRDPLISYRHGYVEHFPEAKAIFSYHPSYFIRRGAEDTFVEVAKLI